MLTPRQAILKQLYPALMKAGQWLPGGRKTLYNAQQQQPATPVYQLGFTSIDGRPYSLEQCSNKNILIVNTASNCGYTPQLNQLQHLQTQYAQSLVVIGFPSNDFGRQEPGSNAQVAAFCKLNYGINFLLSQKCVVKHGPQQHPLFHWLSNAALNGWCSQAPQWNFCKYLINSQGILTHYFPPAVSPAHKAFRKHLG